MSCATRTPGSRCAPRCGRTATPTRIAPRCTRCWRVRGKFAAFGAFAGDALVGFAELSLREYVDGSDERPCGFLEGLYVDPARRRQGLARALVAAGEAWLAGLGVRTLGSDALLDNAVSIAAQRRLGFVEVERVVRFVKSI